MRQALAPGVLAQLVRMIDSVRYGSVQLTIHNGRVVQIEKSEKVRLPADLTPGCPCDATPNDRSSGCPRHDGDAR
jgi:hypothetical protein